MSKTKEQRKEESIRILKQNNIETTDSLPAIESYEETNIRTKEEVVNRCLALCLVSVYAEGIFYKSDFKQNQELVKSLIEKYSADSFFTKEERKFMNDTNPSMEEAARFSWRYEGYNVLLWALNLVDELDFPNKECDVFKITSILKEINSYSEFERKCKLKDKEDILDEADLIYRYSWACVESRLKNKPIENINPDVVYERHYTLNWLINYMGQDWDSITTDT